MKDKLLQIEAVALCVVRKWWRPLAALSIAGTMFVNGILIPVWRKETPDLTGLSLLVTSIAGAFAVREWGKIKGND